MKFIRYFIYLIASCSLLLSCKTTEPLTPQEEDKITFGSYGGFAGAYQEFVLLQDGSLFKKSKLKGNFEQMESMKKDNTTQMFEILKRLAKEEPEFSITGNMTYFIKYHQKGEQTVEWSWSGAEKPSNTLKILYRNLTSQSKKKEIVM